MNIPGESSPCLVDSYTCVRQAMASRSDEDEESHERFGQGLAKADLCWGEGHDQKGKYGVTQLGEYPVHGCSLYN